MTAALHHALAALWPVGATVWFTMGPLPGGKGVVLGYHRDVTDQVQLREARGTRTFWVGVHRLRHCP